MSELLQGDCLIRLKELKDNSIDAIITDPPYELGFMGKKWDSSGIAYNVEMWKECLRVLKPGGHLLSFGGTRTYHRMAVAIEDAGFEIRDMINWCYGSGFPKSLNVGKAYDKKMGNKREVVGELKLTGTARNKYTIGAKTSSAIASNYKIDKTLTDITKGTSPYEGLGTALKPAHEPICMARKPLSEKTVVDNVIKWGTGGIEIDECRIPTPPRLTGTRRDGDEINAHPTSFSGSNSRQLQTDYDRRVLENNQGRFPANVLCQDDALNDGEITKNKMSKKNDNRKNKNNSMFIDGIHNPENSYTDSGSKSRYFDIDVWNEKYGLLQFPKASKKERNKGCKDLEKGCFHPTVKPLALMRYLVTLVSRKGQTVLDPFAGSGTTLVACKELGRNYIGIELEEEYIPIIEARLKATKELEQFKQANLFENSKK